MNRLPETRANDRGRAGCPPVLEIDLTHTEAPRPDALGPQVEWPPAPPTRRSPHTAARRAAVEPDVAALTLSRALHLLDASVAHLQTAMETNGDETTGARIESAMNDIASARETLTGLTDG